MRHNCCVELYVMVRNTLRVKRAREKMLQNVFWKRVTYWDYTYDFDLKDQRTIA